MLNHIFRTILLLVSLTRLVSSTSNACNSSTVFIDIHSRQVDGIADFHQYGLFIGAGSSSQNMSLWPSLTTNDTRIATNDFCKSSSDQGACINGTHGIFASEMSSTFVVDSSAEESSSRPNASYGRDNLNLYTHYFDPSPATEYVLRNHSLTLLNDYTSQKDVFFNSGSVGLAGSSSLLDDLVKAGRIGNRVVGVYPGTAYTRAGGDRNGSIVLGGYDAGRIAGVPHKYSIVNEPASSVGGLEVTVSQISLNLVEGSSIGFIPGMNQTFKGYITTSQYELEFPQQIMSLLAKALGAEPNERNVYQATSRFTGNLSITLSDGYTITYPSEWLTNTSNMTPFAQALGSNSSTFDRPLLFGAAFLHHTYLTLDYSVPSQNSFSLAEAKLYNNYAQPQPLCSGMLPTALAAPKLNALVQKGLVGAIVGGLIGGIGVLSCALFALRKRLQHKRWQVKLDEDQEIPQKSSLRQKVNGLKSKRKSTVSFAIESAREANFAAQGDEKSKRIKITTKEVEHNDQGGIELGQLASNSQKQNLYHGTSQHSPVSPVHESDQPRSDSRLSTSSTLNNEQSPPRSHVQELILSSSAPSHPYTPNSFHSIPLTADLTPRTGNPLLAGFPNTAHLDDADDSDLDLTHRPPRSKPQHQDLGSRMAHLGLTLNTGSSTGSPKAKRKSKGRPPALPLKTKSGQSQSAKREVAFLEEKRDPLKKIARRMFPSSGPK